MKENKGKQMKENKGKIDFKKVNNNLLYLQGFILLIVIATYILTFIYKEKNLNPFLFTSLTILFSLMAYNNKYRFKRKNFTMFYVIGAIIAIISAAMSLF